MNTRIHMLGDVNIDCPTPRGGWPDLTGAGWVTLERPVNYGGGKVQINTANVLYIEEEAS